MINQIKLNRIIKGLTQAELAKMVGVSQQTICKYERGEAVPKHMRTVRSLECILEQDKGVLFNDFESR